MSSTPRRVFGNNSAVDVNSETLANTGGTDHHPRQLGRVSFNQSQQSLFSRWRRAQDAEEGLRPVGAPDRPPIPSALEPKGESYRTPLPVLSMIVLSIALLGEFLSANVSTPFLLFMVEGFGTFTNEADIAFWTGILVASFFLTQFLTSLLWATVAARHGQRIVLFISLLGSAVTCFAFGTSTSLRQAICIRLLQGIFAGAVGVARGCVTVVTDTSNEGRAYAILGFSWGLGGVGGAMIGGTFESPAVKWPGVFDKAPIFINYPYLLPCTMVACITFTGSFLSLFLARDAGPREGAIRLPPEKLENQIPTIPEEEPPSPGPGLGLTLEEGDEERRSIIDSLRRKASHKFSGYFAQRVHDAYAPNASPAPSVPMSSAIPTSRAGSRISRADGSAYGYSGSYRRRFTNAGTLGLGNRRASASSSLRWRRGSTYDGSQGMAETGDLNFAQRLLMANENAVTNIADLWVAAAINVDNEDVFEFDSEGGSEDGEILGSDEEIGEDDTPTRRGRSSNRLPLHSHRHSVHREPPSPALRFQARVSSSGARSPVAQSPGTRHMSAFVADGAPPDLQRRSNSIPVIFSHSGVRIPPAVLEQQKMHTIRTDEPSPSRDVLAPIIEGRQDSQGSASSADTIIEKPPSLASQLPLLVIVQYGLLALHTTTHDQVFLSYLVSKYESGGLNLNAGHFAQLIALMCLAQIVYQFYLYPNIGPPRGRFSHLAMFRLGSLLFIPAYLTVIIYRVFASPTSGGNFILMAVLALSTAVRYCGNTFAYTAAAILLNYMTPPHAVGMANGIAQSIASLARCFGPVLGGYLWAASTQDNPSGYPLGFLVCAGVATVAIAHSFVIR